MAYPLTFLDIQQEVMLNARLAESDRGRVQQWINQVYAQVCIETEADMTSSTASLTAGSGSFTLPAVVGRIKEIVLTPVGSTTTTAPLIRTTLDEILNRRQNGGDVQQAGQYVTHYALLGISQLEVWPTPASADVLTFYYALYPTPLAADTATPIIAEPYGSQLLKYGALVLAGDFKGDPATADWQNIYSDWTARYMNHLRDKPGELPGQFHQWGDGWSPGDGSVVTTGG